MRISKALIILFCTFFSSFYSSAADRKELISTLEKITEINRQLNSEQTKWNIEQESLKLQLSLLQSSIEDDNADKEKLLKILTELKTQKSKLEDTLKNQQSLQNEIKQFLDQNSKFLISTSKALPKSLNFLINEDLIRLEGLLKDSTSAPEEKLHAVNALTLTLIKLQKEVHLVNEVFTLNKQPVKARALYLGTYTGYFKNEEKKLYGRFLFSEGKWQAVEDSSLSTKIDSLFDQFDQKGAPKLISLPIGGKK